MRLLTSFAAAAFVMLLPPLRASAEELKNGDQVAIERCLTAWGDSNPFGWKAGAKLPSFKTMATSVNVLGIGGTSSDSVASKDPQLVLVKPSVAVLTKNSLQLLNPKGWYCLKVNVTVLSKSVIELACDASIADSHESVAVLGSNNVGTGTGVTVLGNTQLKRVGCPEKKPG